jgi:hypothetical protein
MSYKLSIYPELLILDVKVLSRCSLNTFFKWGHEFTLHIWDIEMSHSLSTRSSIKIIETHLMIYSIWSRCISSKVVSRASTIIAQIWVLLTTQVVIAGVVLVIRVETIRNKILVRLIVRDNLLWSHWRCTII